MRFDLLTLYCLAVGTLLLAAAMTGWEMRARPERRRDLRLFAAGYVALAAGCICATIRGRLPEAFGAALANMAMVSGYLLLLNGVSSLRGRNYRMLSLVAIVSTLSGWALFAAEWRDALWHYVSALPIALISLLSAREMFLNGAFRTLRSRTIVIAAFGIHGCFYAARVAVLPLLTARFGADILSVAGKITMYEGVLYSMALPMAVLALVREEAHAELMQVSRTDYLTGLANRRWFFEEGARRQAGGRAAGPMFLLAFDLDHFKDINDQFGHDAGDRILQLFADVVRQCLGPAALAGRLGGEEFAALLPGTDRSAVTAMAQSAATRFAEASLHGVTGMKIKATVSIGLAESGRDGKNLADLLRSADRALYRAKKLGRNRIEPASFSRFPRSDDPRSHALEIIC